MFTLDPRLANDTIALGDFPLCRCLLMNDAQYPWLILVPRRSDLREVHELSPDDQRQLLCESSWLSAALQKAFAAEKMNVANLGNVVAQLHWHIVARQRTDAAWPGPIWGKHPAQRYTAEALTERVQKLQDLLAQAPDFTRVAP